MRRGGGVGGPRPWKARIIAPGSAIPDLRNGVSIVSTVNPSQPSALSARREQAVMQARQRWESAPITIKTMAAAYVGPLLLALEAISAELQALEGARHG